MKSKIPFQRLCLFCGNSFLTHFPKQRYCDKKCRYKKWCKENPEREKEIRKKSRRLRIKQLAQYNHSYYLKNKEKIRLRVLSYRHNHPEWANHQTLNRKYYQKTNGGEHSLAEWQLLKKNFNFKCAICKKTKFLTRDHIVPISKGGKNDISNIQPLCQSCNSRKGNRLILSKD